MPDRLADGLGQAARPDASRHEQGGTGPPTQTLATAERKRSGKRSDGDTGKRRGRKSGTISRGNSSPKSWSKIERLRR